MSRGELLRGDFRTLAAHIPNTSAQLVFVDPRQDMARYADAVSVAARILRPGGSFITYCRHEQTLWQMRVTGRHLRYWWALAHLHGDGYPTGHDRRLRNQWTPLLWYVRGTRGDKQAFVQDAVRGDRKDVARYYVEKLTRADGLVVDLFCADAITAGVCQELSRQWIGFEIDAVDRISTRLAEAAA